MKAMFALGGTAGLVAGAFTFGNYTAQFIILGVAGALTVSLLAVYLFRDQ